MENKAHALAAGAFVIGLLAVLVALVVWFTRDNTVRNTYELSTREPVSGLQPQAVVRYRGIAVGKVTSIGFDPRVRGNVRVLITVDQSVPLTKSSYATLNYQGVTGLTYVALDDTGESDVALKPDNGNPPDIPLKPSTLALLQDRGEALLEKVDSAATRLNQLIGDENQKRVADALENIAQAAASTRELTAALNSTVQTGVKPALEALPPLVASTRTAMGSVSKAAADVSRAANNFNGTVTRINAKGGVLDQLGNASAGLSQSLATLNNATLPTFNRLADDTRHTVRQLGRVGESLDENPQSLLYGNRPAAPGPGEPGFRAPAAGGAR